MLLPVSLLVACLLTIAVEFAAGGPPSVPAPGDQTGKPFEVFTINWGSCGKEAVCGVRNSADCVAGATNTDELKMGVKSAEIVPDCKAGIWIRPLSDYVWIVKLQMSNKAGARRLISPKGGLYLYHNGLEQFGCAVAGDTVIAQATSDRLIDLYRFEQSRLIEGDFYCSFIIEDANKMSALDDGLTTLEYTLAAKMPSSKIHSFKKISTMKKCDIGKAVINENKLLIREGKREYTRHPYHVNLYKKDATTKIISEKLSLTCEKVENSTLETVYVSGDKKKILTLRNANNIECEIVKGDWVYKIRHTSGTLSMQVNKDEPFEAFCAKPKTPSIDWSKCGISAMCAVRDSVDCLENRSVREGHLIFGESTVNPKCQAGIWVRPLNESWWVVKMQVKNEAIDPVKGMFLNHTGVTLFGCTLDSNDNTTVNAVGQGVEMYSFEESRLEYKDCYCSFLIKDATKITSLKGGETFMEYVLTTDIYDIERDNNGFKDEVPKRRQCDMFKAQTNLDKDFLGFVKYGFQDYLSPHLNCDYLPFSKLYARYISTDTRSKYKPSLELREVLSVNCYQMGPPPHVWEYSIKLNEVKTDDVRIAKDAGFEAFCAVPVDSACTDPKFNGASPPKFEQDPTGKVSLTCASDQRLLVDAIDGKTKFYPDEKERPFCKNNKKIANTASWYIKHEEKDFELINADCTRDILCKYAAKTTNNCTSTSNDCGKLEMKDEIRCNVEYNLTVTQSSGEKIINDTLRCDFLKGRWTTEGKEIEIDDNANIYCEKKESNKKDPFLSPKVAYYITWGTISVIFLVVIVFIVRIFI